MRHAPSANTSTSPVPKSTCKCWEPRLGEGAIEIGSPLDLVEEVIFADHGHRQVPLAPGKGGGRRAHLEAHCGRSVSDALPSLDSLA